VDLGRSIPGGAFLDALLDIHRGELGLFSGFVVDDLVPLDLDLGDRELALGGH
jgi:hypothetical protein